MPPDVADQLEKLKEDKSKLLFAADEAVRNGDDSGAKFKKMLAGDIQEKIDELEDKYRGAAPTPLLPAAAPSAPAPAAAAPPGGMSMLSTLGGPGVGVGLPLGGSAGMPPPRFPSLLPALGAGLSGMGQPPGRLVLPPARLPGAPMPLPALGSAGMPMNGMQDAQRTMSLYQEPDLAVQITQQQALEYEQSKMNSGNIEPEVVELAHHFCLSERHARLLNEQLKKRNNTYEDDIAAMYEILKGAKNPADLLMVSIRWMAEDVFRGTLTPNPDVEKAAKKYKLDAPSACKLAEVLESRSDPDTDLKKVCTHLERSNRPSSLVMMMLKDLKAGNPVEESTKQPAIGSYLHKQETSRQGQKDRRRSRSRGRRDLDRNDAWNQKSRSGGRGRSRDRDRGRSRSRGRGRSRSRDRGGRSRSRDRGRGRSGSRDADRRR